MPLKYEIEIRCVDPNTIKYCPRCGSLLELEVDEGGARFYCETCKKKAPEDAYEKFVIEWLPKT